MTIGIYCIKNVKTGQMYIGQSSNIEKRKKEHLSSLKTNNHYNKFLQNSWNKYGEKNFSFNIIETFDENTPFINDVLNDSEEYFIQAYNTFCDENHYNMNKGGEFFARGESNPMYGLKHSNETKEKMRKAKLNKKQKNISIKKNSTGFYRVSKKRKKDTKYGFFYSYECRLNGKRKTFNSVNLNSLKERIIKNGLEWSIIDEKKAKKTLEIERNKVIS